MYIYCAILVSIQIIYALARSGARLLNVSSRCIKIYYFKAERQKICTVFGGNEDMPLFRIPP